MSFTMVENQKWATNMEQVSSTITIFWNHMLMELMRRGHGMPVRWLLGWQRDTMVDIWGEEDEELQLKKDEDVVSWYVWKFESKRTNCVLQLYDVRISRELMGIPKYMLCTVYKDKPMMLLCSSDTMSYIEMNTAHSTEDVALGELLDNREKFLKERNRVYQVIFHN